MRQVIPRGGFLPVNASTCPSPRRYPVVTAVALGIYRGDPVAAVNDGSVVQCPVNNPVLGVASHFSMVINGRREDVKFIPAGSTYLPVGNESINAIYAYIWDDPLIEYNAAMAADAGSNTKALDYAAVHGNMDHAVAVGSAVFGTSNCQLNGIPVAGTAQWRILGVADDLGDDYTNVLGNVMLRVMINEGFHPVHLPGGL